MVIRFQTIIQHKPPFVIWGWELVLFIFGMDVSCSDLLYAMVHSPFSIVRACRHSSSGNVPLLRYLQTSAASARFFVLNSATDFSSCWTWYCVIRLPVVGSFGAVVVIIMQIPPFL